ncbi:MAG TPA: TetR/AcrR family transcriptional regulator [Gemmatimonadaceae bacterium]|nr:TetR/AcrR family transcriptional regulator [Gemmatimonadaceae bacterium]
MSSPIPFHSGELVTDASSPPPIVERRSRPDAADRILRATVRCIVDAGAVALTMHDVAEEAGVSKGLIHYHFHDKDTLLARAVEWMARHLVMRERAALAESTPRRAIDDLWGWLASELERGYVRVLIELAEWRNPRVRNAVRASATARREVASASVEHLFSLLGLRPRLPAALLADVVVAFIDGLAISKGLEQERNARAAFDVFWLSLLSLAE